MKLLKQLSIYLLTTLGINCSYNEPVSLVEDILGENIQYTKQVENTNYHLFQVLGKNRTIDTILEAKISLTPRQQQIEAFKDIGSDGEVDNSFQQVITTPEDPHRPEDKQILGEIHNRQERYLWHLRNIKG